jgi:hypothetical protein
MDYKQKLLSSIVLATTLSCSTPIKDIEQFYINDLKIVIVDERKMSEVLSKRIPHTYDPFAPYCTAYYDSGNTTLNGGNTTLLMPDLRKIDGATRCSNGDTLKWETGGRIYCG